MFVFSLIVSFYYLSTVAASALNEILLFATVTYEPLFSFTYDEISA